VDQERQSAATGKLLDWHVGEDWVAVRADAGTAYKSAHLQRTILLTPNYVLIVDHCVSADGHPHTYDWVYHNVGKESLTNPLNAKPYTFTAMNGYQHLSNGMREVTSGMINARFVDLKQQKAITRESESNSTPATYQSGAVHLPEPAIQTAKINVDLQMLPAAMSEVFTGEAPSRSSQSPVPFVIVRRSGTSANFAALLTVTGGQPGEAHPHVTLKQVSTGQYRIEGPGFADDFSADGNLNLQHHKN
jgi:hypothetical protein